MVTLRNSKGLLHLGVYNLLWRCDDGHGVIVGERAASVGLRFAQVDMRIF